MGTPTHTPRLRRAAGFTLMELMVAVAIIGILAAIGAPSMAEFVTKQRLKSTSSELFLTMMRARSEAIKRNTDIIVQPTGTWASGWTIPNPADSANPIASYKAAPNATISGPSSVTFTASGRVRGSAAVSFNLTASGTTSARCVALDLSGRPYEKKTAC